MYAGAVHADSPDRPRGALRSGHPGHRRMPGSSAGSASVEAR